MDGSNELGNSSSSSSLEDSEILLVVVVVVGLGLDNLFVNRWFNLSANFIALVGPN
jgi:hypothetical protein